MGDRRWPAMAYLALSCLAGPALADCRITQIAELPVTMSGLVPLVPAKINGADVMFEVDSGAFYSMISPSAAAELKLSQSAAPSGFYLIGVGGTTVPSLTTVKTFTLASAPIHNAQFLVTSGAAQGAAGLLGHNVLDIADVEYDLANGVIRWMHADGCARAVMAYWAGDKPYSDMDIKASDPKNPHTLGYAYVNGVKVEAAFDTGAETSLLTLRAARRAGLKIEDADVVRAGMESGIGRRSVQSWITPVASFKVGDEEIRNTRLRIADTNLDDIDMLLGADFFLSHRVYVSKDQRKLYFTYNGGPVFNLTAQAVVQDTPGNASKPSPLPTDLGPEPTDAEGFSRRGAALASRRDFGRAIADFTRAIQMAPGESGYVYQRASALWANKQPDLAMADLNQAIKLKPDNLGALVERAELQLIAKNTPAAVLDLDAAAKIAPPMADIRLEIADLYEAAGQFGASIGQFDLWIAAHEDDSLMAKALNGRCWGRALTDQDLDKALDDCNHALRLAPKTADFLDSRGMVFLRQGRFDKAIADYDMVLALRSESAWSLYGRGVAKLRLGQKAQGQADIAAALALQPTLTDAFKRYRIIAPDGP